MTCSGGHGGNARSGRTTQGFFLSLFLSNLKSHASLSTTLISSGTAAKNGKRVGDAAGGYLWASAIAHEIRHPRNISTLLKRGWKADASNSGQHGTRWHITQYLLHASARPKLHSWIILGRQRYLTYKQYYTTRTTWIYTVYELNSSADSPPPHSANLYPVYILHPECHLRARRR